MTEWNGQPAYGSVFAKIVELHARILRVQAARRDQKAKRVLELTEKASR